MATVQDILDTQKTIEQSISSRMHEFEVQIKSAAYMDGKLSVDKLNQDYKLFKESVLAIFQMLKTLIHSLSLQVEDLECHQRRNALLFNGIEESDKEDCRSLVLRVIQSTMNFKDIEASSISLCHRLGTKNNSRCRPILVRFTECSTRYLIWKEKKRLKSSKTSLSEFLTKTSQLMFSTARKHFGIFNSWSSNGRVYVKLPNGDRKRILTSEELNKLMGEFPPIERRVPALSVQESTDVHRRNAGTKKNVKK